MQPPSFLEFQQLAMQGNVIPVAMSMLADTLTPVSAFMKLCRNGEEGFLLESVEGGEKLARYSFLGRNPRERYLFDGNRLCVYGQNQSEPLEEIEQDVFQFLKTQLSRYQFVPNPELPRFSGGLVGYFGYEIVRLIERLPDHRKPAENGVQAAFGLYDTLLAFDHLRQQVLIITNVFLEDGVELRKSYNAALERLEEIRELLQKPLELQPQKSSTHAAVRSNFSRDAFCEAVRKAKEYIRAGDIFQVVLSQKFSRPVSASPFNVYRALRLINPSPYLYYLQQGDHHIIGSSPELMVRVENREVVVRPIAGTRPRGRTAEEDERLAADLLADEKERAEHVMLVDLGRNDVGRVAEFGEVRLSENMVIEKYSHVMHIVSEIRGRLRPGLDAVDAFKACFPAGTVTGAPKVRAMEIIEELEPERRGVYAGALGYFDFSGNLDTCITIRTVEIRNGTAVFQAGAGIVADSVPEREYAETIHKSNAIRSAIALAEGGLEDL